MNAGSSRQGPMSITEWARRGAPHLDVVSSSTPEPLLRSHNLVAVGDDPQHVRDTVRAWERIEPADAAVGMVVMGIAPDRPSELDRASGADPEGVMSHLAVRSLQGGVPGAVVGALVVALIVLVLNGWSAVVIGAALGGAAFGFGVGAVMGFTAGTGWGEAYRHSFVDEDATALMIASIHSDDPAHIEQARLAVAADHSVTLVRLEPDGSSTPIQP